MFIRDDMDRVAGGQGCIKFGCGIFCFCLLMVVIIVPSSLGKVASNEVALSYSNMASVLGEDVLIEGLQSKPTFGTLIKWPNTNQEIDMELKCNSADAIQIDLTLDFLFIPMSEHIRALTLRYIDFEGYQRVVYSVSRSSVRNSCGDFSALEFQTMRDDVQKDMESRVRKDLKDFLFTTVLTLNLRNIERPHQYQFAVNAREAARADISLAEKETEQELTKANTILQESRVNANKTIDSAETQADIMKAEAEQEIKLAASADVKLASEERAQQITRARTQLQTASINANKTLALARTDAQVAAAFAEAEYVSALNKYATYGTALSKAKADNGLSVQGTLAYFSNKVVGGGEVTVALDAPAKFSWREEL